MFFNEKGALKVAVLKIYFKRCLFFNKLLKRRPATLLKINTKHLIIKVFCTDLKLVLVILRLSGIPIIQKSSGWLISAVASK